MTGDGGRTGAERAAQAGVDLNAARALLGGAGFAVLSTLSQRRPGWPSASLVPLATDARGAPLLLLSDLAQHTRNLAADPRACLFVFDAEAAAKDPRTSPRLAVYGRVEPVPPDDEPDARARYLARQPSARGLLQLDFHLFRMDVEEAQWVGGFAAAGWIEGRDLVGSLNRF
ncbi:MAG TPA: pyridoxamine 5'-phosphate oxidase family protein [Anaeromyxobacteraceae bacterium]|nr:pyridoxamine 5'-phosphate oxidase family protein [Anaeromyxobacteraceae bacterium]